MLKINNLEIITNKKTEIKSICINENVNLNEKENCVICYMDVETNKFISLKKCNHKFCSDCYQESYREMIFDKKFDLKCI